MTDRPYREFDLAEGDRIGVEIHYGPQKGAVLTGVIKSVDTDEETGEVRISVD